MAVVTKAVGVLSQTTLEVVSAQFNDKISGMLEADFVDYSIDTITSEMVIDGKEISATGQTGKYAGTYRIPYTKVSLLSCLPYALFIDGPYPCSFAQFRKIASDRYGIIFEEGDFTLPTTPSAQLTDNDYIDADVENASGTIKLLTSPYSGRFTAGEAIRFILPTPFDQRRLVDYFNQIDIPAAHDLLAINEGTVGSKTFYTATDQEIGMEVLKRYFGMTVSEEECAIHISAVDYLHSKLVIIAKPGNVSNWIGEVEFVFRKADLNLAIVNPLTANIDYPTTFRVLQTFIETTYGFPITAGEYALGDVEGTILTHGTQINAPLDDKRVLKLAATRNSVRWQGRSTLEIQFVQAAASSDAVQITNQAPNGQDGQPYLHQIEVTTPSVDLTYDVVKGESPVPVSATTGLYSGTPTLGDYLWTVKVTDPNGMFGLRTEKVVITQSSPYQRVAQVVNKHQQFLTANTGLTVDPVQDQYLINPDGVVANNRHFISSSMQEYQPNGDATTEGQALYILGWLYYYQTTQEPHYLTKAEEAFNAYVNAFYAGLEPPDVPGRWVSNWIVNGKEPVLSHWPYDPIAPTHSGVKGLVLEATNGLIQIPHDAPHWGQYVDRVTFAFDGVLIWDSIVAGVVEADSDGQPIWGTPGTVYDIEWMIAWNGHKYDKDGEIISSGHTVDEVGAIQLLDHSVTGNVKVNYANRQPVEYGGRLIGRNEAQHNRPCHVPVSQAYFGNASDAEQWFCDAAWLLWKMTDNIRYKKAFDASLFTILEYTQIDLSDKFFRQTINATTPFTDGISYDYTYPSNLPIEYHRDSEGYIVGRIETASQFYLEQNAIWFRMTKDSVIRTTFGGLDDEDNPFTASVTLHVSMSKDDTDSQIWSIQLPNSTSEIQTYDIPLSSFTPQLHEDGVTPYITANADDITSWGGTVMVPQFISNVADGRFASILHFEIPTDDAQFDIEFNRYPDGKVAPNSITYKASHDFNARLVDDDGWRWWFMLPATNGQWSTAVLNPDDARLSGYQPNHTDEDPEPTAPNYTSVEYLTILLDDSDTDATFDYYAINDIPPTFDAEDGYSVLYTLKLVSAAACSFKVGDCTVLNYRNDSLAYCPGVIPFSNNYLPDAEQFDGWHGMPYPGYQHPFYYVYTDQLSETDRQLYLNNVIDYLYDSQVWYHDKFGVWGPGASAYIWNRWDNIVYGPPDTWTMYHWGDGQAWSGYQPRAFFSAVRLWAALVEQEQVVPAKLQSYVTHWLEYLVNFVEASGGISPTEFPMESIPVPIADDFTGHMAGLWLAGSSLAMSLGIEVEGLSGLCDALFEEIQANQIWRPDEPDVMNGGWSPWGDPTNQGKDGMAYGFWTGEIIRGLALYAMSKQ